jgi:hypothetical protein
MLIVNSCPGCIGRIQRFPGQFAILVAVPDFPCDWDQMLWPAALGIVPFIGMKLGVEVGIYGRLGGSPRLRKMEPASCSRVCRLAAAMKIA